MLSTIKDAFKVGRRQKPKISSKPVLGHLDTPVANVRKLSPDSALTLSGKRYEIVSRQALTLTLSILFIFQ